MARARTLGLVIATDRDWETALALAAAARAGGVEVAVFAMNDGVRQLVPAHPTALRLDELGCDVTACATACLGFGLEVDASVVRGSQDDHAAVATESDRVVAFT